jgi:hypothetical protein
VAAVLAGCSKRDKPVVVTPEMEAEQVQAQESVNKSESARQRSDQPSSGRQSGSEQERARQQKK